MFALEIPTHQPLIRRRSSGKKRPTWTWRRCVSAQRVCLFHGIRKSRIICICFRLTWNSNYLLLSKSSVGNMMFHGENSLSEIEYQWDGVCFYVCSRPAPENGILDAPTFGPVSLRELTWNRTLQSTEKSRGSFSTEALVPSRAGKSQDFMPRPDTLSELNQISLVLRI